jgi:hypothetical protein
MQQEKGYSLSLFLILQIGSSRKSICLIEKSINIFSGPLPASGHWNVRKQEIVTADFSLVEIHAIANHSV